MENNENLPPPPPPPETWWCVLFFGGVFIENSQRRSGGVLVIEKKAFSLGPSTETRKHLEHLCGVFYRKTPPWGGRSGGCFFFFFKNAQFSLERPTDTKNTRNIWWRFYRKTSKKRHRKETWRCFLLQQRSVWDDRLKKKHLEHEKRHRRPI